ncbi:MAG: HAMP domain-containing histidine kinase [Chloroflexi bacterium]|nr:HAMP domain-containing histidine kinase [Chloroflexota bacterium]
MGSLQVRLFVTYLIIIGVTLGFAALSLFLLLGGYRDEISYGNLEDIGGLINQQAHAELQIARASGESPPPGDYLLLLLANFFNGRQDNGIAGQTRVAVVDKSGKVIAEAGPAPPLTGAVVKEAAPAKGNNSASPQAQRCRIDPPGGAPLLCVSMPLSQSVLDSFPGTEASAIIVAEPAAELGEVLGDLMPRLAFSGLIGLAAALLLGFLLSQSVAAPLRNIARAARSVARGNYRQRVPATGPAEVRDLAANFNRMTEEVQRSQQTLRDFLANISHELKTPLTSIRGFSQAMVDGTIDDTAGIDRSARIISNESNRVLRLVEELLDLSRIESGQVSMRQEDVDLVELFEHVGEVFALRSEESHVRLEVNAGGVTHIRGDFDRLEQVLNNLLDNAFRHTPAGGSVLLASRNVQPGLLQVTVSDTGQGIPPDDVPHLFERFYRAKANASENGAVNGNGTGARKGHGLGLAITREIVRAHGGEIWATSETGRGTTFVFTLPNAGRPAPKGAAR